MRYRFFQDYTVRHSYIYDLDIDDECEITQDEYGDYLVDGVELSYIIEQFENEDEPEMIKINGVRIIKSDEMQEIIDDAQYLNKIKED